MALDTTLLVKLVSKECYKNSPILVALYRTIFQRLLGTLSVELEVFLRADWTQHMDCWINYCSEVYYLKHTVKIFVRCGIYN